MGRPKNSFIKGQRFNKLTVLEFSHTKHDSFWRCKCDCGQERITRSSDLKTGQVKDCGYGLCKSLKQIVDLTGQKFNKLTVLKFSHIHNRASQWLCECECKNTRIVAADALKYGSVKTCNNIACKRSVNYQKFPDLSNKVFNSLTVIKLSHFDKDSYWICKCVCGNEITASRYSLYKNDVKHCGRGLCKSKPHIKDITGKKFNRLTVLDLIDIKNSSPIWKCRCDCGEYIHASYNNISYNITKSCGKIECKRLTSNNYHGSLDLSDKKFGKLSVINKHVDNSKYVKWNCICDCGKKSIVSTKSLVNSNVRSCGCLSQEFNYLKIKDIKGQKFGSFTVIEWCYKKKRKNKLVGLWKCRCDCGNIRYYTGYDLRYGIRLMCKPCADLASRDPLLSDEDRAKARNLPEVRRWKKLVLQRDNYTCQITGKCGTLAVHHLASWASNKDLRFDIDNGISILIGLHILFHQIYGNRNNTAIQFQEFKNNLTKEQIQKYEQLYQKNNC